MGRLLWIWAWTPSDTSTRWLEALTARKRSTTPTSVVPHAGGACAIGVFVPPLPYSLVESVRPPLIKGLDRFVRCVAVYAGQNGPVVLIQVSLIGGIWHVTESGVGAREAAFPSTRIRQLPVNLIRDPFVRHLTSYSDLISLRPAFVPPVCQGVVRFPGVDSSLGQAWCWG